MRSAESPESRSDNDLTRLTAGDDEAWRAEVALRVNSYRSRRKQVIDENSPALDFGPAAEAQIAGSQSHESPEGWIAKFGVQPGVPAQVGERRSSGHSSRNAFDMNYYRRQNAESMSQGTSVPMVSKAVATALAKKVLESETEAENTPVLPGIVPSEEHEGSALDMEIYPAAAVDSYLDRYCISEPQPEVEPPIPEPAPPVQKNLLVFRRPFLEPPLAPQPSRDELAEPMNHRPRILEVPEDIMPAVQGSLFPEIRLDADEQESANNREPEIDVPLRVAPASERLIASLADMAVVMAAGLLFSVMAWRALPEIPHNKIFFMMLGAVTLLLWTVYQHLFLLYAGCTPGMSLRGIRLSTFDGGVPAWQQRSCRAHFMFISLASVSLGFLWALVDEDKLCWHDRISRTFLTNE